MTITYISKKDLVTCSKCFLFQQHGTAPSHIPSLRNRCKGDGWFDAIYPCSQEIMFPSLRYRQVQSGIMCLAFLKPQPPLVLVHGFPIPALTLSCRWQVAPSPLPKPQPDVQTEGSPPASPSGCLSFSWETSPKYFQCHTIPAGCAAQPLTAQVLSVSASGVPHGALILVGASTGPPPSCSIQ